jgi:hypothetical protein
MTTVAAEQHPALFEKWNDLLRNIDQSKYAVERAEHVLAFLHFCADEGRVLFTEDEWLRRRMQRQCREYQKTATYYRDIVEEAARILLLLSQEPTVADGTSHMTYDPTAHHC